MSQTFTETQPCCACGYCPDIGGGCPSCCSLYPLQYLDCEISGVTYTPPVLCSPSSIFDCGCDTPPMPNVLARPVSISSPIAWLTDNIIDITPSGPFPCTNPEEPGSEWALLANDFRLRCDCLTGQWLLEEESGFFGTGPYAATSVQCDPFEVVFDGVFLMSCTRTSTGDCSSGWSGTLTFRQV